jgi:hypothetical protein
LIVLALKIWRENCVWIRWTAKDENIVLADITNQRIYGERLMKNKIRSYLAVGLLAGPMAANAIPVFTNASFETGDDSGWTVANPFGGVIDWNAVTGGALGAQDGTNAVWFGAFDNNPGSSYGQTVGGFTIGAQYTVTFGMVPEHGSNSVRDPSRTVASTLLTLTGADVASQSFSADCNDPTTDVFFSCAPGWQDMPLTFTALSSNIDFTWTADLINSPLSWEFGFDNIRLEQVPVPAAAWLFGSGLLGLMGMARRKKAA